VEGVFGVTLVQRKVRSAFDSLNKRDVKAFLSNWAEDAVFVYPSAVSVGGKIEGKDAIEKWFQGLMEQFPKLKFTVKNVCVQNMFAFSGANVVAAEWDIAITNRHGKDLQNSGVTVITTRGGKPSHHAFTYLTVKY